jgi:hypothetical protein
MEVHHSNILLLTCIHNKLRKKVQPCLSFVSASTKFSTTGFEPARKSIFWSQAAKCENRRNKHQTHPPKTKCDKRSLKFHKHSHGVLIADLGMKYFHTSIMFIYIILKSSQESL